jgi:hypothetical protein
MYFVCSFANCHYKLHQEGKFKYSYLIPLFQKAVTTTANNVPTPHAAETKQQMIPKDAKDVSYF